MARVDSEDDSLRRYIVRHYRYDPERHVRRHVVVAAFDSEREYKACFRAASEELERRKAGGEDVDPAEHVSGTVHEPGDRQRAANGRLIMRALSRGVQPGPWMDDLEMPSNIAFFSSSPGPGCRPRGRLRAFLRRRRTRHH